MANTYSREAQLLQNTPSQKPYFVGRIKRIRNRIDLTAQASGDTVTLLPLPLGSVFCYGVLNGPTLATATVAIGDGTTAGLYRAAAVFTAAVATLFGVAGPENVEAQTLANTIVTPVLTVGTAALPGAGVLTVDMYVSTAS